MQCAPSHPLKHAVELNRLHTESWDIVPRRFALLVSSKTKETLGHYLTKAVPKQRDGQGASHLAHLSPTRALGPRPSVPEPASGFHRRESLQ